MHSFEVHSNESACRKSGRLGLEQVTRASEEGKTYSNKDDGFHCKKNDNQLYNLLKKTILPFVI